MLVPRQTRHVHVPANLNYRRAGGVLESGGSWSLPVYVSFVQAQAQATTTTTTTTTTTKRSYTNNTATMSSESLAMTRKTMGPEMAKLAEEHFKHE